MTKADGMRGRVVEHARTLVGTVTDRRHSEPVRVGHTRTLADYAVDQARAVSFARSLVGREVVAQLLDAARGGEAGIDYAQMRREVRALSDLSGGVSDVVVAPHGTDSGYGPAPIVREYAYEDQGGPGNPVLPGMAGSVEAVAQPWAVMDPDPADPETPATVTITDVAGGEGWHFASLPVETSRQVVDFIDPTGHAILDQLVLDDVDLRAEMWVLGVLNAAAGGTTAVATGNVAAALVAGETAAGGAGLVEAMIVHTSDLPAVRAALPAAWADTPHPTLYASGGQTSGTVTFLARGAAYVLVRDYYGDQVERPNMLGGRESYVVRPVFAKVRRAAGVHTVTGV